MAWFQTVHDPSTTALFSHCGSNFVPNPQSGKVTIMNMDTDSLAKTLWDYNRVNDVLVKADMIMVLGSHDLRIADYAAKLYLEGWAPIILFSGGFGRLTGDWKRPEAEMLSERAGELGVPAEAMILESRSTNTGENIEFSKLLLQERGIEPRNFIVVQKPYMERRAYATFKKRWPDKDFVVSSPPVPYDKYPNEEISRDELIHILVGDTQRNRLYGARGYQVEQEVPSDVWAACEELVRRGYSKYVITDSK